MSGSYSSKLLRATLILPQSNFPGTASNTLTLVGYRMKASIEGAGSYPATLNLTVYGMKQADMNAVTVLWAFPNPTAIPAIALIQLEASSDGGQSWCQVFEGRFVDGSPDYAGAPDVALRVLAQTGYGLQQLESVPPTSYPGVGASAPSIVSIAQYLAKQMGFTLEPNGVSGSLSTPYFPGTYMDQFRQLCEHANLDFYFDGNATLAICPKNTPRQNKPVPVFSPTSGLVGFPTIQRSGIHIDTIFTPALILGGNLQVADSIVPGANGTWFANKTKYDLESLVPDGPWFAHIDCVIPPSGTVAPA